MRFSDGAFRAGPILADLVSDASGEFHAIYTCHQTPDATAPSPLTIIYAYRRTTLLAAAFQSQFRHCFESERASGRQIRRYASHSASLILANMLMISLIALSASLTDS